MNQASQITKVDLQECAKLKVSGKVAITVIFSTGLMNQASQLTKVDLQECAKLKVSGKVAITVIFCTVSRYH